MPRSWVAWLPGPASRLLCEHDQVVADPFQVRDHLRPEWVHAMHGGSLTAEALPNYVRALHEQAFAFEGRLLRRELPGQESRLKAAGTAQAG